MEASILPASTSGVCDVHVRLSWHLGDDKAEGTKRRSKQVANATHDLLRRVLYDDHQLVTSHKIWLVDWPTSVLLVAIRANDQTPL